MKEWPYTYTLSMTMDPVIFAKACKMIESLSGVRKSKPLYEDFLDGSQYQEYDLHGKKILISSDWNIGAVIVEADLPLDCLLGETVLIRKKAE